MVSPKAPPVNGPPPRLAPAHLADLRASGLSDETIVACRFKSTNDRESVRKILNWKSYDGSLGTCLVIPFFDADGKPNCYTRLKPGNPRSDNNGKPIKYESPKGTPGRAYFPPGTSGQALKDPKRQLLITEGEKKAAKASQEGFPCIGLVGVWGWQKSMGEDRSAPRELIPDLESVPWQGRAVFIVFDSDAAEKDGVRLAEYHLGLVLQAKGAVVKVVRLPTGPDGAKVGLDDYLVDHRPESLRKLMDAATEPEQPGPRSACNPDAKAPPWPDPLPPEAFHGLAGEIVRFIEPSSEADPAALLFQTLVAFGNLVGRSSHFVAEGDAHYLNEYVVLVGKTSKGRKGSSWGHVRKLFQLTEAVWTEGRIQTGLSSGEGLIHAVRDPVRDDEGELTDPGVPDKRLLVYEAEFASVLKQVDRQGNILSSVLRQAWECGSLQTLTKRSPTRASGAHISVIGHGTVDELRRHLSTTEMANGFANRHLWVCVRRSKVLPEGGAVHEGRLAGYAERLREVADFTRTCGQVRRNDEARQIWFKVYEELSEGRPGLSGSLLGRAEAHVMRLACLYAMLDRSEEIGKPHMLAALALWDYVEASVRFVFGDSLGDPVADEILRALRNNAGGLARSDISKLFGHNRAANEMSRGLAVLLEYGLARYEKKSGRGRPEERWYAVKSGT